MRKRLKILSVLLAPIALGAFLFAGTPAFFAEAQTPQCVSVSASGSVSASVGESVSVSVSANGNGKLPHGVVINGVPVGGLAIREAKKVLEETEKQNTPVLKVETPKGNYVYSYPEIDFLIDFAPVLEKAEKNGKYEVFPRYFLKGAEEKAERICADNRRSALDACVRFGENGFSFDGEQTGISCDRQQLEKDLKEALTLPMIRGEKGEKMFTSVVLKTEKTYPRVSLSEAKRGTRLIGEFTTWFSPEDRGRCQNIALAAKKLDGFTIRAGEEFSFNAAVGERTKRRGFKEAKIIQDGEFILGTGGGVCQVSTTLFNAALLSGLKITARNAHSLAVSYVEPSRDAMVSSASDLKFQNPFPYPVYLSVKTGEDSISAKFYGQKTDYEYKIVGVIKEEILPPEPLVKYGETEGEIKKEKKGIKSESYLETYLCGKLIRRERLYSDAYAPTRGIIGKKIDNTAKKTASNVCVLRKKML